MTVVERDHSTARTGDATGQHLRWPAERFYWSEIDAKVLGRSPDARRLLHLMEPDLPVPFETVHAAFVPMGGGRYVGCAVERSVLEREVPAEALSLQPDGPPPCVSADVDCSQLELLTGRYEPKQLSRVRRRAIGIVGVAAVLCLSLLLVGVERRIAVQRSTVSDLELARRQVLVEALGPSAMNANADLVLASELNRLRVTRGARLNMQGASIASAIADPRPTDVTPIAARLAAVWPRDLSVMAQTISIAPDAATVSATVQSTSEAQQLADALAALGDDGAIGRWQLAQPRLESIRGAVNVSIRLERTEEGEGRR